MRKMFSEKQIQSMVLSLAKSGELSKNKGVSQSFQLDGGETELELNSSLQKVLQSCTLFKITILVNNAEAFFTGVVTLGYALLSSFDGDDVYNSTNCFIIEENKITLETGFIQGSENVSIEIIPII